MALMAELFPEQVVDFKQLLLYTQQCDVLSLTARNAKPVYATAALLTGVNPKFYSRNGGSRILKPAIDEAFLNKIQNLILEKKKGILSPLC